MKTFITIALFFIVSIANAQEELPVIKAASKMVDIRDGDNFKKDAWTISPQYIPHIYTTSSKNQWVTFYTDLDSISFYVSPGDVHEFIILFRETDSVLTQVKYVQSGLEILQKARAYNYMDQRQIPEFTYDHVGNNNLIRLRQTNKLDSVAGGGNEISKILNLMHWVHNTVRHSGDGKNPDIKNAIEILRFCKKERKGVNCRMLATVLNECYLSMGFKSRCVTCMPKETEFDDCHVINMVYSEDLQKWLYIDPTFDAYIMSDKGVLLSIEEVRDRLIFDGPMILNPEANWNRETSQTQEYYLYTYMAKNLYRLKCPATSEFDAETPKQGKSTSYIELVPLDGIIQSPQRSESTNNQTGHTYVNYLTNNPDLFWVKP